MTVHMMLCIQQGSVEIVWLNILMNLLIIWFWGEKNKLVFPVQPSQPWHYKATGRASKTNIAAWTCINAKEYLDGKPEFIVIVI